MKGMEPMTDGFWNARIRTGLRLPMTAALEIRKTGEYSAGEPVSTGNGSMDRDTAQTRLTRAKRSV